MTKITTETYRRFIRDNADSFNYDGTISMSQMRMLVSDAFGSSVVTMRTHMANLLGFGFITKYGEKMFVLNPRVFPELVGQKDAAIVKDVDAEQERLRAEAKAEADALLKAAKAQAAKEKVSA